MYLTACVSNDGVAPDQSGSALDSCLISAMGTALTNKAVTTLVAEAITMVEARAEFVLAKYSSVFASKIKMGQTLLRLTHFESGCGGRI